MSYREHEANINVLSLRLNRFTSSTEVSLSESVGDAHSVGEHGAAVQDCEKEFQLLEGLI